MDRMPYGRYPEREAAPTSAAPASPFPPPVAQPPMQIPFSDPFHTNRDPFFPGQHSQRESSTFGARQWAASQDTLPGQARAFCRRIDPDPVNSPKGFAHGKRVPASNNGSSRRSSANNGPGNSPPSYPSQPTSSLGHNGIGAMSPPYDSAPRRRSFGGARGPHEPPLSPTFAARHMPPPPSPPPNSAIPAMQLASAPRGPPTSSPFAGVRDLGSHRPTMSLSNILGSGEERAPQDSSNSTPVAPASAPKAMQPPSPGRARSISMRESYPRGFRDSSPPRADTFGERNRISSDLLGSPQHLRDASHSFRAFQPPSSEHASGINGQAMPGRPSSQPVGYPGARVAENTVFPDPHADNRVPLFRPLGDPSRVSGHDTPAQPELAPFPNGSAQSERQTYHSPQSNRENHVHEAMRLQSGPFSTPVRDEAAPLFRPAYQTTSHPAPETPRESIEGRVLDMRRQYSRQSPTPSDLPLYDRARTGFVDRPMTLEEHQRLEAMHRDQQREREGSIHRSILNLSPDLNRKGRNSPLPQAVQGAQPRHVGPGGDHPGIKTEFGRMFSGLGSGVGSATPNAGQSMNGVSTPSRMSPARYVENGDLVRTAVAEIDENVNGTSASRSGKRDPRRSRDDVDRIDGDGRETPDLQRGIKRAKTAHHHHHHVHPHHHHHHHQENAEPQPGSFSMLRFSSNPPAATHHHHHHHHAHPGHHHHHHAARPAPLARKPSITINSKSVLDACADMPRKHLGSQLYTTQVSLPPAPDTPLDVRAKFSSKSKPLPLLEGKENCTFTVRVPRFYLSPTEPGRNIDHTFGTICQGRQLWGSEVYTDDSDVVAAAVHAGWLQGDFGDSTAEVYEEYDTAEGDNAVKLSLSSRPRRPAAVPPGHDAHITVLILPPLEAYAGTVQNGIHSREWGRTHDGMSFMIFRLAFVEEGASSRFVERGAMARKARLAAEEERRREAIEGLMMCSKGVGVRAAGPQVGVGA